MALMLSRSLFAFSNWIDSCAPYMGMRARWYWIIDSILRIFVPLWTNVHQSVRAAVVKCVRRAANHCKEGCAVRWGARRCLLLLCHGGGEVERCGAFAFAPANRHSVRVS